MFAVARTRLGTAALQPADNCITKTHFPHFNVTLDQRVKPSRLLRLVRNPVDAVLSIREYDAKKSVKTTFPGARWQRSYATVAKAAYSYK